MTTFIDEIVEGHLFLSGHYKLKDQLKEKKIDIIINVANEGRFFEG